MLMLLKQIRIYVTNGNSSIFSSCSHYISRIQNCICIFDNSSSHPLLFVHFQCLRLSLFYHLHNANFDVGRGFFSFQTVEANKKPILLPKSQTFCRIEQTILRPQMVLLVFEIPEKSIDLNWFGRVVRREILGITRAIPKSEAASSEGMMTWVGRDESEIISGFTFRAQRKVREFTGSLTKRFVQNLVPASRYGMNRRLPEIEYAIVSLCFSFSHSSFTCLLTRWLHSSTVHSCVY